MNKTISISDLIDSIRYLKEKVDLRIEDDPNLQSNLASAVQDLRELITPIERVEIARHPSRPHIEMIEKSLFTNFVELRGDRCFGDDPAIYGGIGEFRGYPVC